MGVTTSAAGDRAFAHEFRNALAHEYAAADVTDHRIAAVARRRVRLLDARDRIEDRAADSGVADIAGDHAVALTEHPALRHPFDHLADPCAVEDLAAPGTVAGVVGELHGVHRPDLDSDALQRKDRGRVANMAVGDVRLDGEQIHAARSA